MADSIRVPVKVVGGVRWGDLSALGLAHEFVGETVRMKDDKFSFAGGHRVRLYYFKKNVHWRVPAGMELDISSVKPAVAPRKARK